MTKSERREQKENNRRKMRVSGRSVLVLQSTIVRKAEEILKRSGK